MLIKIQIFFLFLLAPIIGSLLFFIQFNPYSSIEEANLIEEYEEISDQSDWMQQFLFEKREVITETKQIVQNSKEVLSYIQNNANQELLDYLAQQERIESLVEASTGYQQRSTDLIEQLLATMLGDPIGQTFGENSIVKVYSLEEAGYRGFMAKVRVLNPDAIRMVLANDEIASSGETTSQAAKRSDAILAINAGGFTSQRGQLYPIGITVIDGEIVTFYDTSISFIGFNQTGNLVGGNITSREEIKELGVQQGASFTPTLLKDGEKLPIPSRWANTRHPRTLVGHFTNGDLFFMVIDGRRATTNIVIIP